MDPTDSGPSPGRPPLPEWPEDPTPSPIPDPWPENGGKKKYSSSFFRNLCLSVFDDPL